MIENLKSEIESHRRAIDKTFSTQGLETLELIVREILKAFKDGHKVLLCGNGGSAADAQHIAAEFIVRFKRERRSLPAIALTTDTSILTAAANDYSFQEVYARQVRGLGQKGDVLIALSTSGNSKNVIEAVKAAKEIGIVSIGLTGGDGGALKDLAEIVFVAQTSKTQHIQETHITALHAVTEVVESILFGD